MPQQIEEFFRIVLDKASRDPRPAEAVAELVRSGAAPAPVRSVAATLVPEEDRPRFVKMVLTELRNLHEGNIARYRPRLAEFRAWREKQRPI